MDEILRKIHTRALTSPIIDGVQYSRKVELMLEGAVIAFTETTAQMGKLHSDYITAVSHPQPTPKLSGECDQCGLALAPLEPDQNGEYWCACGTAYSLVKKPASPVKPESYIADLIEAVADDLNTLDQYNQVFNRPSDAELPGELAKVHKLLEQVDDLLQVEAIRILKDHENKTKS